MAILLDRFRENVSKHKDPKMRTEGQPDIQYPTGFPSFDFINGCKIDYVTPTGEYASRYSVGIADGSMCMLIGRSGCGKTTFGVQVAARIADMFPESVVYHDDIEGGSSLVRRKTLTGWSDQKMKDKYRYRNAGISAENFYETMNIIKELKIAYRDDFIYDTGVLDNYGSPIIKMQPTIYLLDSVALLMPEKFTDEENLSGSMSATAAAKTNSSVFKRIIPMLKAANIILIMINHITDNVSINPMQRKKSQVSYLKQDENLPGGKTIVYLSNLLLRFDDHKLKETEGLGIAGALVDVQIVKSRSGKAGSVCTLVFDQDVGFDADLSLYILLKNHKMINGAGAYLYIGDNKDVKFRQSEIRERLHTDPEFANIFMEAAMRILMSQINEAPNENNEDGEDERIDTNSISNMLLSKLK